MRDREDELFPAQPAQGLVFLLPGLREVFCAEAFLPDAGVIRFDDDAMTAFRVFDHEDGRHLHVVQQARHQGVGLRAGPGFKGDLLDSEVLPLRDGPGMQGAQGVFHRYRRQETFHRPRLPAFNILACVEGDAGFRETVIRRRQVIGRPVGGMHAAEPGPVRHDARGRAVEPELGFPASQMGESVLAEIPEKQGDLVPSLAQERSQVHLIIITVLRVGSALEGTFEDDQLAIDPEPVFAVHGDARGR